MKHILTAVALLMTVSSFVASPPIKDPDGFIRAPIDKAWSDPPGPWRMGSFVGFLMPPAKLQSQVQNILRAAEDGDALYQNRMGQCYLLGQGVARNEAEAAKWYRKAADQGSAIDQFNMGRVYESGLGVTADLDEAVRWFRKAARQGDAASQLYLGEVLIRRKMYPEAVAWFRLCAKQQKSTGPQWFGPPAPVAEYHIGELYYMGLGVIKDKVEAHVWLNLSSAHGCNAASELRDRIEKGMTEAQLAEATQLARQRSLESD